MIFRPREKGQALVLIALAAVGLFGFAALAIDGSAVFSDRRHSQNASDTAAFAGALARVRGNPNWTQVARDRASSNGYDETDGITKVYVHLCSTPMVTDEGITLTCQGLPTGADPDEYIHVYIKSTVRMTFARVIGRQIVINRTDAVVRAKPVEVDVWFDGFAMVSANIGCAEHGDFGPFDAGGNGVTVINNSGVFVNSSCSEAFEDNGSSNSMDTDTGICIVGGIKGSVSGMSPPPDDHCGEQVDINQYWMPDTDPTLLAPYCNDSTHPGSISESGGEYIATPGHYAGGAFPDESPAKTLRLQKGVYCFDSGIGLNAGWEITTDLNDNGVFDPDTEGIFFYIRNGDVTFNGGSDIDVHAMTSPAGGWPSELMDYFMFIPMSNHSDVKLTGGSGSTFTGMILAPNSNIEVLGNGGTLSLHTQIIGLNTRITGSGTIDITYDPDDNPPAVIWPKLSPIK